MLQQVVRYDCSMHVAKMDKSQKGGNHPFTSSLHKIMLMIVVTRFSEAN